VVADYTLVNLKDEVEDQAPKFGHAPNLEARFAAGALGLEKSGLSYQRLAPNFRHPFGHHHGEQEEIYIVLSGGGRVRLDDDVVEVRALDALRVPPQTTRAFEAGPDGVELLAFGAPASDSPGTDAKLVPGWWSD
jgi:mannose-6-phosphate isomerase-like protein (cupin superfamily)